MTARQNDPETIREEGVNVLLAQSLRDHGVSARAERRSRRGTPDIRVELRSGDLVILECKWNGSANLLDSQLEERLKDFPEALGMVGVLYPSVFDMRRIRKRSSRPPQTSNGGCTVSWRGVATATHKERGGSRACRPVAHSSIGIGGRGPGGAAAGAVGYALEQAGSKSRSMPGYPAALPTSSPAPTRRGSRAALRIGCLVLFNALAFQDRLAARTKMFPPSTRRWNRVSMDYAKHGVISATTLTTFQSSSWRPVSLMYLPMDRRNRRPVIDPLVKAMKDTRRLEGHDLSGRLFHTLLTDAKFTGAYYTSVPAATLLSRLVFQNWPPHVDWKDHEFPASLNVADLACGTGTLLMAVAAEVERRHTTPGAMRLPICTRRWSSQALHGYDVQLSAVHFAATSLAMLNPNIQFDRMNLYVMPLGAEGSNISLGSLDFLGAGEAAVQFALSVEDMGVATKDAERMSGKGLQGCGRGCNSKAPGPRPGNYEPAVHSVRGRQPTIWQPPSSRAAETSERVVAPSEAEAGVRHCRARRCFRCRGFAEAASRRGPFGSGIARHRVHRTILGADPLPS